MSKTRTQKEELLKIYKEMIKNSSEYIKKKKNKKEPPTITPLTKDLRNLISS